MLNQTSLFEEHIYNCTAEIKICFGFLLFSTQLKAAMMKNRKILRTKFKDPFSGDFYSGNCSIHC
jgi:hypothetical protein